MSIGYSGAEQSEDYPQNLTIHPDHLQDESGVTYPLASGLAGRGQAGLGAFYRSPTGQELLIKGDEKDPAACIMEGTAYFLEQAKLLPNELMQGVNFARAASAFDPATHQHQLISIQSKITAPEGGKVASWDTLVYGEKRNPRTLMSVEAWYPGKVIRGIERLETSAKFQLASGILLSALAGDESLHVGQFMAIQDEQNNIIGIKRIDFGARNRFAKRRNTDPNEAYLDPFSTSPAYSSSGQRGKKYVTYLLAQPNLNHIYAMLWKNLSLQNSQGELLQKIYDQSKLATITQLSRIAPELQADAIQGVLGILNKSLRANHIVLTQTSNSDKIEELATIIAQLDSQRAERMFQIAAQRYDLSQSALEKKISSELPEAIKLLTDKAELIAAPELHPRLEEMFTDANSLAKHILTQLNWNPPDLNTFKKAQLCSQLAIELFEAMHLNLYNSNYPDLRLINQIDSELRHFQTINDFATHCINHPTYIPNPEVVKTALNAVFPADDAPDSALISFLSNNAAYLNQKLPSEFLNKLFARYHLSPTGLNLNSLNDHNLMQQLRLEIEQASREPENTFIFARIAELQAERQRRFEESSSLSFEDLNNNEDYKLLQSYRDLSDYTVATSDITKRKLILDLILSKNLASEAELLTIIKSPEFSLISTHTGVGVYTKWAVSSPSRGKPYVDRLLARHDKDFELTASTLLELAKDPNSHDRLLNYVTRKNVGREGQNAIFYALTGEKEQETEKTTLHYLMQYPTQSAIDVIKIILENSRSRGGLGFVSPNANVDIIDILGKTPIDWLVESNSPEEVHNTISQLQAIKYRRQELGQILKLDKLSSLESSPSRPSASSSSSSTVERSPSPKRPRN